MYEQQFNPFGGNLAIVKGYFKSGKILTLGIFYIISVILTFILSSTISFTAIIYRMVEYFSSQGISVPSDVRNTLINSAAGSSIGTAIISSIIPILMAVAFIIIFAKSRNDSPESSPIAGVTIMHVLAIISLIFTIIGVVLVGIVYIILFIAGITAANRYSSYSSYSSGAVTGGVVVVLVVLGIILLAYAFISIFYAVSCKNFYRSVKRSMTTTELESKGAVPYGVFNIIMAVFSVITMIVYMVAIPTAAAIIFISYVVTILIQIFTAIMTLGYNKYINQQKVSINTAPYGAAPMNAAPSAPYNMPDYASPQNPSFNNAAGNNPITGQGQPRASFCPNCGAKTEPGAPFCPNCGTKL